jgi:hypothetical protein
MVIIVETSSTDSRVIAKARIADPEKISKRRNFCQRVRIRHQATTAPIRQNGMGPLVKWLGPSDPDAQ